MKVVSSEEKNKGETSVGVRFEEVYQRQKNAVYGYLSYMTKDKDTAEDLAQETFLKVYLGLKGFKEDCSEKTWCLTIARNTFLSFARKKQPVLLEEADMERLGAGYESGPEEKLLKEEKAKLIREVLSSLNADDRTIILLRDYEKMAYADIARVTGLSETVVKVRLHRARLKYRSRYEQRGGDSCGM